ncbi:hypothetical protein KTD31_01335 [Burkholderia multivorans]|jgi:hypothetical protein|uniref:hypothetical protein n=1 Tax=Burkholderia multivorans TaxID=87883 RepID=UPI001C21E5B1|nr:hypothetical protein [Burkholderia multivorans]MBU9200045.1 hypothetical protein [Burkholderia multivorans]MDN8078836.1 hypothetical protein [Burkholderia multivorans]
MYIAHLKQCGEGCDYAIACGETLVRLKASTWQDVPDEVRQLLERSYGPHSDHRLERCTVYEVVESLEVQVDACYAEIEEGARQAAQAHKTAQRRAEYERLKREFGDS